MTQPSPSYERFLNDRYELAGRVIDPVVGTLTRAGKLSQLRRKQLEVLAILASAEGKLVLRQALIEQAWDGNSLVGDGALTDTISALRQSLDDHERDNPLIRTIPRRGYQLSAIAQVIEKTQLIEQPQRPSFEAGAEILGKPGWKLQRLLSENAVSQTWLAQDAEGADDLAPHVFRFCRNESHLRLLQREITLMRYLRESLAGRRDIAGIVDWQLDEPPYFLEMRYTAHGSLSEYAQSQGGFSQIALADRLRWVREIATALAAVHAVSIVHRNVGAASVFLDTLDDHVCAKLGEFGFGELTDRARLEALKITAMGLTLAGSEKFGEQMYLAPERLIGQTATTASDVYALGVLLFQLLVGDLTRAPSAGWEARVQSAPVRDLIVACVNPDVELRPTAQTLSEQLTAFEPYIDVETPASVVDAKPSAATPDEISARAPAAMLGQAIGPYRLMDKLGEGGMGTVYLAEQRDPVQRQVAVKLIKAGMDTAEVLARFEAERQALALMNHVNVAAVYDAGAAQSGRPYFAMEYVPGLEITAHCDARELNFRQRIELFLQVCDGVLHAHQKGIIHRDLKPSNILIKTAQGQPATAKIIDFGVAKSLQRKLGNLTAHTQLGSFVGTPVYSSPEQISGSTGDVDTRSDVYSLGVVLYELLAGVTPYSEAVLASKSPLELSRMLSSQDSPPLLKRFISLAANEESAISGRRKMTVAQMKQTLGSDLSWIVAKCLARDPNERYASVLELDKDLQRWLESRPVEARPATFSYRLRKMVRRNRGSVLLGSMVTLALLITTAAAVVGFVQTKAALKEANTIADFQVKQIRAIDPAKMGLGLRSDLQEAFKQRGVAQGLDAAAMQRHQQQAVLMMQGVDFTDLSLNQLDIYYFKPALTAIKADFAESPLLQAKLWFGIAKTMREIGRYEPALVNIELALQLQRKLLGEQDLTALQYLSERGEIQVGMGKYDAAEADMRAAYAGTRQQLGPNDLSTLALAHSLVTTLSLSGKKDEAYALMTQVLAAYQAQLGSEDPLTLKAMITQSSVAKELGKTEAARVLAQAALEGSQRVNGANYADTLEAANALAAIIQNQGYFEQANVYLQQVLDGERLALGNQHPSTLMAQNNLATSLIAVSRLGEAEVLLRETLVAQRELFGPDYPPALAALGNLADVLKRQRRLKESESYTQELSRRIRPLFGDLHPNTLISISKEASTALELEKFDVAIKLFQEIVTGRQKIFGLEHKYTLVAAYDLSTALRRAGKLTEAKTLATTTLNAQKRVLGPEDPDTLRTQPELATILQAEGQLPAAETLLREALAVQRRALSDDKWPVFMTMSRLVALLRERGELSEALALGAELMAAGERVRNNHYEFGLFQLNHAHTLAKLGKYAEAEALYLAAFANITRWSTEARMPLKELSQAMLDLYAAWKNSNTGTDGLEIKMLEWGEKLAEFGTGEIRVN